MTKTADEWLAVLRSPDPEPLQIGDEIEFEKADGTRWWAVIAAYDEGANEVELMCWNGRPVFLKVKPDLLVGLRIIKIDHRFTADAIAENRAWAERIAA